MDRIDLKIDWATYEAAKYACLNWHYSRCMPRSKQAKMAVYENGTFIGCLIFGLGAGNLTNGKRFGLAECFDVAELMRVALNKHQSPTSKIVAIAIRMLRKQSPNLKMLISLSDPRQGHVGGIYQAGNWIYIGTTSKQIRYFDKEGKEHHPRHLHPSGFKNHWGKPVRCLKPNDLTKQEFPGKHIYLMPFNDEIREKIEPLSKPYPKRASEVVSDGPDQGYRGGAEPTRTLQMSL